jgi:t-SNARE complex subunit (syntaxin)
MRQQIADACLEISSQTNELKRYCKKIGTRQDDEELRTRIHELRKRAFEKVESTTELFNKLIESNGSTADQGQKIAIDSLRKNFSTTVNEFSQVYENIVNRLQENPRPRVTDSARNSSVNSQEDDKIALLNVEQQQQDQQQDQVHTSYVEQRAEMMGGLANDMVQLHELMTSIQHMVVEQGEQIDHIDQHIEHAAVEVERGKTQLGVAVRYKKCSRRLVLIIVLVVAAVVAVVVIVAIILGVVIHNAATPPK